MTRSIHRGDGGETQLGSGERVRKDHARVEAVGCVDELSSFLGLARAQLSARPSGKEAAALVASIERVQRELYWLGSELAGYRRAGDAASIRPEHLATLEGEEAALEAELPKLRGFILPGGGVAAAQLHVARAVCRRLERQVVRLAGGEPLGESVLPYLNRLSLVLFSMARRAAALAGAIEEPAAGP